MDQIFLGVIIRLSTTIQLKIVLEEFFAPWSTMAVAAVAEKEKINSFFCPISLETGVMGENHLNITIMKDFLLVYRMDYSKFSQRSPEEMQANTKRWMDWIGGIAAQNKLTDRGNRLNPGGKIMKPHGLVTDGPYTETKESLGGYSIVKAASLEEAVQLAEGCPVFALDGNVEIREIGVM